MDLGIRGRVALVCGASSGLGWAVSRALAMEGVKIAACARTAEKLEKATEDLRKETKGDIFAIAADVSVPSQVKTLVAKTVEHFGKVDILVCNAGGPPPGSFLSQPEDAWQKAVELNLLSTITLCREAVPHMRKGGWGRIINITSFAAKQPHDGLILSNTARAGVLGFAKSLANEMASSGILVNTVCPGAFETERHTALTQKRAAAEGISFEEASSKRAKEIPLGRFGRPAEFGDLVAFLASERAAYITGTVIQIDGGVVKSLI